MSLICRSCSKNLPISEYRENQLSNPRPQCNSCATENALARFASNMSEFSNARVIRNPSIPKEKSKKTNIDTTTMTNIDTTTMTNKDTTTMTNKDTTTMTNKDTTTMTNIDAQKEDTTSTMTSLDTKNKETTATTATITTLVPKRNQSLNSKLTSIPSAKRDRNRIPEDTKGRYLQFKFWCSGCELEAQKVYRCSRCKKASFCSDVCQQKSWKKHKLECFPTLEGEEFNKALEEYNLSFSYWNTLMERIKSNDDVQALEWMESQVIHWIEKTQLKEKIGKIGIFELLFGLLDVTKSGDCKLRLLMIIAPLLEGSATNVKHVLAIGGVNQIVLMMHDEDSRIVIASVALLGSCVHAVHAIGSGLYRLGATTSLWEICSNQNYGALDGENDALVCLQATGVLLQILPSNKSEMVDELLRVHGAVTLVHLLKYHQELENLDGSINSHVGHHLTLNVLALLGLILYSESEEMVKESFAQTKLSFVLYSILSPNWNLDHPRDVNTKKNGNHSTDWNTKKNSYLGGFFSRLVEKLWSLNVFLNHLYSCNTLNVEYAERALCLVVALIPLPNVRREFHSIDGIGLICHLIKEGHIKLIPGALDVILSYLFGCKEEYDIILEELAQNKAIHVFSDVIETFLENNLVEDKSLIEYSACEATKLILFLSKKEKGSMQLILQFVRILLHEGSIIMKSSAVLALCNFIQNDSKNGKFYFQSANESTNHVLETKLKELIKEQNVDKESIQQLLNTLE